MATSSWISAVAGDWNTGSLWSGGQVPVDGSDVTIDVANPGSMYGVTIAAGESHIVNTLTLNAPNDGTNKSPYLGAVLQMNGTLTFANPGSVASIDGSLQSLVFSNGGTFVNAGTVAPFIQGSGNVLFTGTNGFYVENLLQSLGTVTVDTSSISEIIGNTLTDGIYDANGAGNIVNLGGPLEKLTVDITKIEGPVAFPTGWTELTLTGTASAINQWNGTAYVGIESTLTDIGAAGTVDVLGLRDYVTANTLTVENKGMLNLQAGTVSATGGIDVSAGGVLQGSGTITSNVLNNGTVIALASAIDPSNSLALANTLDLVGTLSGTGVVDFDFNDKEGSPSLTPATLIVNAVAAGQTIVMNGDDTLVLNTPTAFAGAINAKAGDKIILNGATATAAAVNNGTLVVSNGTATVARLALAGTTVSDGFTTNGSIISVATLAAGPSIAGDIANQALNGAKTIDPFRNITISDSTINATETVTVALSAAANGGLSGGSGTYNSGTGVYTVSGTAASVTKDLDGLVFTPTAGQGTPGQSTTTSFTIKATNSAGRTTSDTGTSVVVSTAPAPTEVVVHGAAADYIVVDNGGTLYLQDTVSGRDGTQTLPGVDKIAFSNGIGLFDPTGSAEDVSRLYPALLGRAADSGGVQYWSGQIDNNAVPLSAIANSFAASPEFMQSYGALANADFVNLLYKNVLGRPADTSGSQYWTNALSSGTDRGSVAASFAESQENVNNTLSTAGSLNNAEAYRLYVAALDRTPDPAGQAFWAGQLAVGVTPTQEAGAFIGSSEFQAKYGTLSPNDFVSTLYENVLHRAADTGGQQYWTGQIQSGVSESTVLVGFSDSLENRVNTAGATHANWVLTAS